MSQTGYQRGVCVVAIEELALYTDWKLIERVGLAGADISRALRIPPHRTPKTNKRTKAVRHVDTIDLDSIVRRLRPSRRCDPGDDDDGQSDPQAWKAAVRQPILADPQAARWFDPHSPEFYPSPWSEVASLIFAEPKLASAIKRRGRKYGVPKSQFDDLRHEVCAVVLAGVLRNAMDWTKNPRRSWWGYCWGFAESEISRFANAYYGRPRTYKPPRDPRADDRVRSVAYGGSPETLSQGLDLASRIEAAGADARQQLDEFLSQLPEPTRETVRARLAGVANQEIAREAGVSESAASRIYNRAVLQLRRAHQRENLS